MLRITAKNIVKRKLSILNRVPSIITRVNVLYFFIFFQQANLKVQFILPESQYLIKYSMSAMVGRLYINEAKTY